MARSPLVEVHDLSPQGVVVDKAHAAPDCLGDFGPVRCHASWMKSSTSNRTPPPRACIYPGITRTRNFCELCTIHTRTKNFCELCTTFIPVPGTSVTSVRPCHNTRGTGTALLYLTGTSVSSVRPCHKTRNFWKFYKTFIPVPGTSVSSVGRSCPYPDLLEVLLRLFIPVPGTSVSSVGHSCPYPELL